MKRPARWASWILVVASAPLAWTPAARADGAQTRTERAEKASADQRARDLFVKGDAAYAEARYEDALAAFQEAYELSGRPQLLFNVANALERLARYADAASALEKYLASGKAKDEAVVRVRLANLKKRVDEEKRKKEKDAAAAALASSPASAPPAPPAPAPAPPAPAPPAPSPAADGAPSRVLPWALVGGGGVLVATGAVFGVLTLGARSDAKNACTDAPSGHLCDAGGSSAIHREKAFGVVADVSVLAGVILGGVGAYLLFAPARVKVAAQRGGGGVDVALDF